jgi:uncharacterized protein
MTHAMMGLWLADLHWLLTAPPVLNPHFCAFENRVVVFSDQELQEVETWHKTLRTSPDQQALLTRWMNIKPPRHIARLGRYAEHLLEFFLRYGPCHSYIASNLQIWRGADTVGEVDFLLRDHRGGQLHWELAVKYFVCQEVSNPTVANLQGPDSIETFDQKISKIMNKQLRQQPPAPFDASFWHASAFTRGWMFYRDGKVAPVIPELSQNHPSGFWIERHELSQLGDSYYMVLPRARWLSPATLSATAAMAVLQQGRALGDAIDNQWAARALGDRNPGGVLVCQMALDAQSLANKVDCWKEVRRGFVMPSDWQSLFV